MILNAYEGDEGNTSDMYFTSPRVRDSMFHFDAARVITYESNSCQYVSFLCFTIMSSDELLSMFSEKRKELKVLRGYEFRFQRRATNGVQRWTCATSKTCKAYLKLESSGKIVDSGLQHDHHAQNDASIQMQSLSAACFVEDLAPIQSGFAPSWIMRFCMELTTFNLRNSIKKRVKFRELETALSICYVFVTLTVE